VFSKIGPTEIIIILVVALLIFGPSKLPGLGKSIGEGLREFKKSMKDITGDSDSASAPDKKA
jgi:TatA/E family protein of Tat protein translocase